MNKKNLRKIRNDAEAAKEISKVLITIDSGNTVNFKQNDNFLEKGIGGVIAVIGPSGDMEETLLLEIGTGRSKPYAETIYPGYFVNYRKKFFEISFDQYNVIAPYVFKAIQLITDLRIAKWKNYPANPFRVKYNDSWYTKRSGFTSWEVSVETIPSIRFAFAKTDEYIVNDMRYLFCSSDWTRKKMVGLGKYIDKALSEHRNKKRAFKQFEKLKNTKKVKKALEKWPKFLAEEMLLKHLPNGNKNFFFYELAELIGWDGVTPSEKKKKSLTSLIGKCKKNKIIKEFGNKINYVRENDNFIFFDVCPSDYDPTKK